MSGGLVGTMPIESCAEAVPASIISAMQVVPSANVLKAVCFIAF